MRSAGKGDGYALHVVQEMTGRVALASAIADLSTLRERAKAARGAGAEASLRIPLDEASRGRITLGATTFLFQFVAAPIAPPKPQLPLSVRTGGGVDWMTTIIAAFSFLMHFGLVGAIYSDWLDPVFDENLSVAELVARVDDLPPAPPVEEKPADSAPTSTAAATATSAANAPEKHAAAGAATHATGGAPGPRMTSTRAAEIGTELAALNVTMIKTLNANGRSTDEVLGESLLAVQTIDEAAKNGAGVGRDHGLAVGGGFDGRPGERGPRTLVGDANRGNDGPASTGQVRETKGPTPLVGTTLGGVKGGTISNAAAVVAGMSGYFRHCYDAGLRDNPDMRGKFTIIAKVGPNGEVQATSMSGGGSLSSGVMSCAAGRVATAQFAPPDGGGASVVIPISMEHQ